MPYRLIGQYYKMIFPVESPFSQVCLGLCLVDKTSASITIEHYFVKIVNDPIVYAEVPTYTTSLSVPSSSFFKKNPHRVCLSSLSSASDLSFAISLCYLLSGSDQDSAACLVCQAGSLNSHVMSSLPYKLQWMWGSLPPPPSSCM